MSAASRGDRTSRRSGRGRRRTFVIPLTFGNQSDWSRNVRAAGGCTIRLNGVDYRASKPELADRAQAAPFVRAAFHPVLRAGFRMLSIRQFLLLALDDG